MGLSYFTKYPYILTAVILTAIVLVSYRLVITSSVYTQPTKPEILVKAATILRWHELHSPGSFRNPSLSAPYSDSHDASC
jgi:hypothetical protein